MKKHETIIIGLVKAFFGIFGIDWNVQGWASEGRTVLFFTLLQVVIPTITGVIIFCIKNYGGVKDFNGELYFYLVLIIDVIAFILRVIYYFYKGISLVIKQK